jgi:hypothetical protein
MLKDKHFYMYAVLLVAALAMAMGVLVLVGTDKSGCPQPGDPISRPGAAHCYYQTPVGG